MLITHEYEACADCLDCIANGESNLIDRYDVLEAQRITTAISNVEDMDNCQLSATGKELGYTRSPCDICKRGLTGFRYEVVGLI